MVPEYHSAAREVQAAAVAQAIIPEVAVPVFMVMEVRIAMEIVMVPTLKLMVVRPI